VIDVVGVPVSEEIVGGTHGHIKPEGIHVEKIRCCVKIENRRRVPVNRLRGHNNRRVGSAEMKVDADVSGLA
jgi:hypothetical protein